LRVKSVEGNVFPVHAMRVYKGMEVLLHLFVSWTLIGAEWQTSRLVCCTPGKEPR